MKQSTMNAYAEVDMILNLMDKNYLEKIPLKLRQKISERKSKIYDKVIVKGKPLEEQNLSQETLDMLAVLNYNYWCKDEAKKKELIELYRENQRKYEEEIRIKYNPDNIFKNRK